VQMCKCANRQSANVKMCGSEYDNVKISDFIILIYKLPL
jgi:hypothetical protein